ncbi:MAG: PKD repeat protein [Planctomycetota bacterium]|jgi:PKD repeat protein
MSGALGLLDGASVGNQCGIVSGLKFKPVTTLKHSLFSGLALASVAAAQTPIAMPAFNNTYTASQTRGFWFQAPVACVITGLEVPNEAALAFQVVEVLDLGAVAPTGTVTPVAQLFYDNTSAAGTQLTTSILLTAGNWYGILGACNPTQGDTSHSNSYGATAAFSTTILGNTVPLTRLTAGAIASTGGAPTVGIATSGQIARVLVDIVPATGVFAGFSATPTSGSSPLTVNFTDATLSNPNPISSWAWDFDNDGIVDSTVQNPTHVYTDCGVFDVSLTVSDGAVSSTETKVGLISVDPLVTDFTATPTAGAEPLIVTFTDTSSGGSAIPILWEWDFDNDGITDDFTQNPVWAFMGGTYSVSLSTTFACAAGIFTVTETKTDLIQSLGATQNSQGAELFEFQFNEVRHAEVDNASSTTAGPGSATVNIANWQVDAGRVGFKGDGATGALGNSGLVATGFPLDQNGSMTIAWWQRMTVSSGTALAYAFGGAGGNWRTFTGGVAANTLWYRGSSIGDVQAAYDVQLNPGVWEHMCLVVDDVLGTADWYANGVLDTSTVFAPGTHTAVNTDYHVGYHTSTASIYTDHYDMDDYRHYNRALSALEVTAMAAGRENAAGTTYGSGCAGSAGTPEISATGIPDGQAGNPGFAVNLASGQPNALAFLVFGLNASNVALPFDVGLLLGPTFAGCLAETNLEVGVAVITDGAGSASSTFAIPGGGLFNGQHVYAQWLVFDTTVGAISNALDINIE